MITVLMVALFGGSISGVLVWNELRPLARNTRIIVTREPERVAETR